MASDRQRSGMRPPAPQAGAFARLSVGRIILLLFKPFKYAVDRRHGLAIRQLGSVDHHNRQTQRAGSMQFGLGAGATCILADHPVNGMLSKKRGVSIDRERATGHDHRMMWQGGRCFGRIYEAQDIMMLGLGGECLHVQAAKGQHNPFSRAIQRRHGGVHIGDVVPGIARLRSPRGSGQRQQRNRFRPTGMKGVPAHLRGKRVCGVNDMADVMLRNVAGQPVDTSKAADPVWDRLSARGIDTTRIAERGLNAPNRKGARQGAGFGCAAKNKEVGAHV